MNFESRILFKEHVNFTSGVSYWAKLTKNENPKKWNLKENTRKNVKKQFFIPSEWKTLSRYYYN